MVCRTAPPHAEIFYLLLVLPHFCPVNLQHSSCMHVFSISVDPDQLALLESADLDLQ